MASQITTDLFKEATGRSIGWAVVMIVLGLLAVFVPLATGIAVSIVVGWIIVAGGISYIAYAFSAQGAGAFLWRILVGVFYILGGGYLVFNPGLALASLTLVVAVLFLLEGLLEIGVFFAFRALPGTGWILFDGIVTLLLAYLIGHPWPASSVWAIGTLLGVNLITSGFTRLMVSAGARRMLKGN